MSKQASDVQLFKDEDSVAWALSCRSTCRRCTARAQVNPTPRAEGAQTSLHDVAQGEGARHD